MGDDFGAFVAVQECAQGNECVGEMWLETEIFNPDTPIREVWAWSERLRNKGGRLMLTLPTSAKPSTPSLT